jgi:hypothetical protein
MDGTTFTATTGFSGPAFTGGTMAGTTFTATTGFSGPAFTGGSFAGSSIYSFPESTKYAYLFNGSTITVNTTTLMTVATIQLQSKGNPVFVQFSGLGQQVDNTFDRMFISLYIDDSTLISPEYYFRPSTTQNAAEQMIYVAVITTPAAGLHTYSLKAIASVAADAVQITREQLLVREIL